MKETCNSEQCVLYISTSKPISWTRIEQVGINTKFLLNRTFHFSEEFNFQAVDLIHEAVMNTNISLLVIDTIGGLLPESDPDAGIQNVLDRISHLGKLATILKALSTKYNFVLICINTVVSYLNGETIPSHGLAWTNFVNDRFYLLKGGGSRRIHVFQSPNLPSGTQYEFQITDRGIIE
jgi:RecA/RadA recombinase